MIIADAGPLKALADRKDPHYEPCRAALVVFTLPMVTTWPALAQAMDLAIRDRGAAGRKAVWGLVMSGQVEIGHLNAASISRCSGLMTNYARLQMDLADATLVALAEQLNERRIFTLDPVFEGYKMNPRRSFEIVPRLA